MSCPTILDADTYTDINSPAYHQAGIEYWEVRSGAFVHSELAVSDWLTVTGGLRLDYNSETGTFLSPRLTAVFRPIGGHFLRLGAARAFRKPSFWESRLHPDVEFPDDGLFQGSAQYQFREFMTRMLGNIELVHEEITAFEAGYLGNFFDDRLTLSLDIYFNIYTNSIEIKSQMVPHETWIVDLRESSFAFRNGESDRRIFGSELELRFNISRGACLTASWTHRELVDTGASRLIDNSPKNMLSAGGRFLTDWGLLGSLYLHARGEFWDKWVDNPAGLMEPPLVKHMDNIVLIQARLGLRWQSSAGLDLEAGAKLFLPVASMPTGLSFRFRERGGGVTPFGVKYGADELTRVVHFYLKGSL